jgi:excisionase family DNA binding protein
MNISAIPDSALAVTASLLGEHCPGLTKDALVKALTAHDCADSVSENLTFITQKQAAERFGVSVWTITRMIKAGELPARKVRCQWRIPADAICARTRM